MIFRDGDTRANSNFPIILLRSGPHARIDVVAQIEFAVHSVPRSIHDPDVVSSLLLKETPLRLSHLLILAFLVGNLLSAAGCSTPTGESPSSTQSGEPSRYGQSTLDSISAEFEEMKSVLGLSGDEADALSEAHVQHFAALESWFAENGQTISDIRGEALDAARDRDLARLNSMDASGDKETIKRLQAEEDELLKGYRQAVEDSLSDDSRTRWRQHTICDNLLTFLSELDLSADQIQQIKDAAPDALRRVSDPENWRGYGTAELEEVFESRIVLNDQKVAFKELQDGNKMRMLKWSWGN
ncbi:MAG: hypothetical protein AAF456_20825 [Planctomycetota bacterium]